VFALFCELTFLLFSRLLEAIPRYVEKPAMIGTANTALFNITIFKRAAPVGTMNPHKADLPLPITEKHKLFTQNLNAYRDIAELFAYSHCKPIAPEPFPGGRPGAHMG